MDKLFEAEDLLGDHVMWRDESAVPSTSTLEMDLSGSLMKAAADLSEKVMLLQVDASIQQLNKIQTK